MYEKYREALRKNPLFLYDSDADGLCAYLLLYRMHQEGRGILIKASPIIDDRYLSKVQEIGPDAIFVLDIPRVAPQFVQHVQCPVFWIDHHEPQQVPGTNYINPKIKDPDAYISTTRLCWDITTRKEDLWIAAVGSLADWHFPDFMDQVAQQYPELDAVGDLPTLVYQKPIGKLVRVFSFLLKGQSKQVKKNIAALTKITHPSEILKQTTPRGNYLWKQFTQVNTRYEAVRAVALKQVTSSPLLLFLYGAERWSFTADLANELSTRYPKKVIIIARNKGGSMKCSLRAKRTITSALAKALEGIEGYGGGHPQACGAVIAEQDWGQFLQQLKEAIK